MFKNFCKRNNDFFGAKDATFTLLELLMVIGIIGMIALILMPFITSIHREKITVVQLKKAYTTYANTFNLALAENGSPDSWGLTAAGSSTGLANLNKIMSQYLSVMKNCGTGSGCFPDTYYKNLSGKTDVDKINQDPTYTKMLLTDGTSIGLTIWSPTCTMSWGKTFALQNVCGMMTIDVNGAEPPNTYGLDYFGFALTKYSVIPVGTDSQSNYPFSGFCNRNSAAGGKGNGNNNNNGNNDLQNGLSCAAWVLYNENMDYTNCNGLNWNGKTTCK